MSERKTMTDVEGILLSYKREPPWCATNIWLVKFRVKIHGAIVNRQMYVTGLASCDKGQSMEAALAVAATYGGKRIRIISTEFVATGAKAGFDWQLQKEHWERRS